MNNYSDMFPNWIKYPENEPTSNDSFYYLVTTNNEVIPCFWEGWTKHFLKIDTEMCNRLLEPSVCKLQYLPNDYIVNRNLKWKDEVKYQFEDGTWTPWMTWVTLSKYKEKIINGPQIIKINSR